MPSRDAICEKQVKCTTDLDASNNTGMFGTHVKESPPSPVSAIDGLPDISLRQLEVFKMVYHENSYTNAALELRSTRSNIKRVCDDFSTELGHPLFDEDAEKQLSATAFAQGLVSQMGPLSRALRRLNDGVKSLHQRGRLVRFAAASEYFGDGLLTDFLSRLQIRDLFLTCFVKMSPARYRTALLNAECDVYFGCGVTGSDRLDLVDLGPVPWKITCRGGATADDIKRLTDLPEGEWQIALTEDADASHEVLEALHQAGAKGGRITVAGGGPPRFLLEPDINGTARHVAAASWPRYRFSAVLRKHHPYSELKTHLAHAAAPSPNGHGS